MAPRKQKKNLVMLIDVGKSSLDQHSLDDLPYLDKEKLAVRCLIENKIFFQENDEIGIITMGDPETNNFDKIANIREYDNLRLPSWEHVKFVNDLESSRISSNWIDGLDVALNYIEREVQDPKARINLVIFSNFKEPADVMDKYEVDRIKECINGNPNLYVLFLPEDPSNEENSPSLDFVKKVCENNTALLASINDFIEEKQFYGPSSSYRMPWKCNLELSDLQIPTATYIKTTPDKVKLKPWQMHIKKEVANAESQISAPNSSLRPPILANQENLPETVKVEKSSIQLDSMRRVVGPANISYAYKFGGTYIPVSEEDRMNMKARNTFKSLKICGFVPRHSIKVEYWYGKGCRTIVPQAKNSASAFYSLVQAMVNTNSVAIVRKVYNNNNKPKMGALFPSMREGQVWCLVHIEIPYSDQIRVLCKKRWLKQVDDEKSDEKIDAVTDLIDSLTLSDEEAQKFQPGALPNIGQQYMLNQLSERALNPDKKIAPISDHLLKYVDGPKPGATVSRRQKIASIFDIKERPQMKKRVGRAKIQAVNDSAMNVATDEPAMKMDQEEESELLVPKDIEADDDLLDDF